MPSGGESGSGGALTLTASRQPGPGKCEALGKGPASGTGSPSVQPPAQADSGGEPILLWFLLNNFRGFLYAVACVISVNKISPFLNNVFFFEMQRNKTPKFHEKNKNKAITSVF